MRITHRHRPAPGITCCAIGIVGCININGVFAPAIGREIGIDLKSKIEVGAILCDPEIGQVHGAIAVAVTGRICGNDWTIRSIDHTVHNGCGIEARFVWLSRLHGDARQAGKRQEHGYQDSQAQDKDFTIHDFTPWENQVDS